MGGDEGGGGGRGGETCDEEDNLSSSEKFTRLRYYLFNFSSFAKKINLFKLEMQIKMHKSKKFALHFCARHALQCKSNV